MEVHKIAVKFFAEAPVPPLHRFVPVFQRWIQTHALEDHLLIDVADYAHVAGGPGVVLVAWEANLYFDQTDNKPGLLYARKAPLLGTLSERLRTVASACVKAAMLLEREALEHPIRFKTSDILVRFDDRLNAPNTPERFELARPAIDALAGSLYSGSAFELHRDTDARKLLQVRIHAGVNPSLSDCLARLGEPVAV
jgi:hypothetical protein